MNYAMSAVRRSGPRRQRAKTSVRMSHFEFRPEGNGVPIGYILKVSPRAKYARLRMVPHTGLVVVVPEGYSRKKAEKLIHAHEAWIRKAAARMETNLPDSLPVLENGMPLTIVFRHLPEVWRIVYRSDIARTKADLLNMTLHVPALPTERERCRKIMLSWIRQRAANDLLPMLAGIAETSGFTYSGAGVRLLHSRWGSCSSLGVISLSTKLLFLPDHLVRHILLHELCHTAHMDHSRTFRELLRKHEPRWRSNERELKTAWKYIPEWVSAHP